MSTFGLGFRPKYYRHVVSEPTAADFYEVISENFMGVGGRPARFLDELRERYPVYLHGVGLGIAGNQPLRDDYLGALRTLADRLAPPFVSDHLCWTTDAHRNSHDLLPVQLTEETLTLVAERVAQVQERLGRRFLLENPSAYFAYASNDMDEATFLAELVRRTGCGVLLDVNNLFVNAANLGYDAVAYLRALPPDAVGYFHLAGHTVRPDVRIDTHDAPVCAEVWTLYRLAAHRFPHAPTLLERDDNYPELAELEAELNTARQLHRAALADDVTALEARVAAELPRCVPLPLTRREGRAGSPSWARTTGSVYEMVAQTDNIEATDLRLTMLDHGRPVDAIRGINVYNDAYLFRLRDCIRDGLDVTAAIIGEALFTRLISAYLADCPPSHYDVKWAGARLPTWLRETHRRWSDSWSNAALADMAALELCRGELYDVEDALPPAAVSLLAEIPADVWERLVVHVRPCARLLTTAHDIWDAWSAGDAGVAPAPPPSQACTFLVYRFDEDVYHERLSAGEARLFAAFADGAPFAEACRAYAEVATAAPATIDTAVVEAVVERLAHWLNRQLISGLS